MYVLVHKSSTGEISYHGFTREPTEENLSFAASKIHRDVTIDCSMVEGKLIIKKQTLIKAGIFSAECTTLEYIGELLVLPADDVDALEYRVSQLESILDFRKLYVNLNDMLKDLAATQKEMENLLRESNASLKAENEDLRKRLRRIGLNNLGKTNENLYEELTKHPIYQANKVKTESGEKEYVEEQSGEQNGGQSGTD